MSSDAPASNRSQLALFVNASAGAGLADELIQLWEEKVPRYRQGPIFSVRDPSQYDYELDQAIAFCETSGAALVVAGGDGTFNGVLKRDNVKKITLGLIPTGTFNYFARSHGLSEDPGEAIDFLLTARPVMMPLARVNDKPFIVSVSLGVHPRVIEEREVHTRYVGRSRLAAWLSGIWTVLRARHLVRATLTTEKWRAHIKSPLIMINFNSAQLFGLDYRFQYQPNKLAVLRLKPASYWGIFAFIIRALSGHVLDEGSLECEYAESLTIETQRKRVKVALDGELLEFASTLRFSVEREAFACLLQGGES